MKTGKRKTRKSEFMPGNPKIKTGDKRKKIPTRVKEHRLNMLKRKLKIRKAKKQEAKNNQRLKKREEIFYKFGEILTKKRLSSQDRTQIRNILIECLKLGNEIMTESTEFLENTKGLLYITPTLYSQTHQVKNDAANIKELLKILNKRYESMENPDVEFRLIIREAEKK